MSDDKRREHDGWEAEDWLRTLAKQAGNRVLDGIDARAVLRALDHARADQRAKDAAIVRDAMSDSDTVYAGENAALSHVAQAIEDQADE